MQARSAEAQDHVASAFAIYQEIGLPQEVMRWGLILAQRALDQHDAGAGKHASELRSQTCALAQWLLQQAYAASLHLPEFDQRSTLAQMLQSLRWRLSQTCGTDILNF